jgi:hypothetical protein
MGINGCPKRPSFLSSYRPSGSLLHVTSQDQLHRVDRLTFQRETKFLAEVASGSARLRRFFLSTAVILCLQRPFDQPRLGHLRWLVTPRLLRHPRSGTGCIMTPNPIVFLVGANNTSLGLVSRHFMSIIASKSAILAKADWI